MGREAIGTGRVAAVLALAAIALTGCASTGGPRCQFAVSNAGGAPIRSVSVQTGAGATYESDVIPPKSVTYYKPVAGRPPLPATVRWIGPDGQARTGQMAPDKPVRGNFRGRVCYEIAADGTGRTFVLQDPDEKVSPMPWGRPESWEGTVGIPGLTDDQGF